MFANQKHWQLTILDANPPTEDFGGLAVGDVDGDGKMEALAGGTGALVLYRPSTSQKATIHEGRFDVGLALADIDNVGKLEAAAAYWNASGEKPKPTLSIFKQGSDPLEPWERFEVDNELPSGPHDILFHDVDGDGKLEMLINTAGAAALYLYRQQGNSLEKWDKEIIESRLFAEGLAAADLDGDGITEIINGPDYFKKGKDDSWQRTIYAPGFRNMCRTALVDITGNGKPDIVAAESEYPDGRMSWFENNTGGTGEQWIEHEMDRPVNFAHSLQASRDEKSGAVRVFLAEMATGGWMAPHNYDAFLQDYISTDNGKTWRVEEIYRGTGTHQALLADVDNDGELEVVGKEWGKAQTTPRMHIWKKGEIPAGIAAYKHRFLDRDKQGAATDIFAADLDGDGSAEVICGHWWYRLNDQERRVIPDIFQALLAYDVDGDGKPEIIATRKRKDAKNWYNGITAELCWAKPVNLAGNEWETYDIGVGTGDWPHGSLAAPLLPGGKSALVTAYHSSHAGGGSGGPDYPEIWEIPDNPKKPWTKRVLAEIKYGEELLAVDLTGNGMLDIVAGYFWLENMGDGNFTPHRIVEDYYPARAAIMDVTGNGRPDLVLAEEVVDYKTKKTPWSRLAWFENPEDPRAGLWPMHVIDKVRCPHSVGAADLDGDGELEIVCGEHDPFKPYRARCCLFAYKKADPAGKTWKRYTLDDRFEHHDGTKIVDLPSGKPGILSHGWSDSIYVNLWEPK